jgi:hypothetical protein
MNKKIKYLLPAMAFVAAQLGAQVAIGTLNPENAAMLDVSSTTKGILIPRISLPSTTHDLNSSIQGQPNSLLIYNTGEKLPKGFYFWNGLEWKNLLSSSIVPPSISNLICQRATLEPSSLKGKQYYSGLLKVPYFGGNGGKYSAGEWFRSTGNKGLYIRLKAGRLEYGAGELVFDVAGMPEFDSPVGASFTIDFSGRRCVATVGDVQNVSSSSIATVGPLEASPNGDFNGYHRVVTSPDGKFSVRVFVPTGTILANADLQIRSNTGPVSIAWNGLVSWTGGRMGTGNNSFYIPDAGKWYGTDNENGMRAVNEESAAWGNADVYFEAPEQRIYTWTSSDTKDKTVYVLTFMMGAPRPDLSANPGTATQTKAFLRIEEIRPE